jgi:hypothetical protein
MSRTRRSGDSSKPPDPLALAERVAAAVTKTQCDSTRNTSNDPQANVGADATRLCARACERGCVCTHAYPPCMSAGPVRSTPAGDITCVMRCSVRGTNSGAWARRLREATSAPTHCKRRDRATVRITPRYVAGRPPRSGAGTGPSGSRGVPAAIRGRRRYDAASAATQFSRDAAGIFRSQLTRSRLGVGLSRSAAKPRCRMRRRVHRLQLSDGDVRIDRRRR